MAVISRTQAERYAMDAGFSGSAIDIVCAIAQAESGLDTRAYGQNHDADATHGDTHDRGILQINSYWHREVSDACAYDPACAFESAFAISSGGTVFKWWTTYRNGDYKQYLRGNTGGGAGSGGGSGAEYVFPLPNWHGSIVNHHIGEAGYPNGYPGASDLFADRGHTIVAMHAGKVLTAGGNSLGGNTVYIAGTDGLAYYYAHMNKAPLVRSGQQVAAGQPLGEVGNTGNAATTDPHLHMGIGHTILTGAGATGGAGEAGFDAVELLRSVYGGDTTSGTGGGVGGAKPTSITVYDQPGFNGKSHTLTGDVKQVTVGLYFGHAGDIRSIKLTGGGAITVYGAINYAGPAVVISSDVEDTALILPWYKAGLKVISSIRFGSPGGSGSGGGTPFLGGGLWNRARDGYFGFGHDVHQTLITTPGMKGVILAIDQAEQFPGVIVVKSPQAPTITGNVGPWSAAIQLPFANVGDGIRTIGATIGANFWPAMLRALFVLLGVLLIGALIVNLAKDSGVLELAAL